MKENLNSNEEENKYKEGRREFLKGFGKLGLGMAVSLAGVSYIEKKRDATDKERIKNQKEGVGIVTGKEIIPGHATAMSMRFGVGQSRDVYRIYLTFNGREDAVDVVEELYNSIENGSRVLCKYETLPKDLVGYKGSRINFVTVDKLPENK